MKQTKQPVLFIDQLHYSLLQAIGCDCEDQCYGSKHWPDTGEIDAMEQVGFDPIRSVSSVHIVQFNYMKTCHPTHSVTVDDACDNLKVYNLDWNPDKLQMFLGNEQNPFEQRVLL
ncbi:unnamed protein product [Rotaria socialis]